MKKKIIVLAFAIVVVITGMISCSKASEDMFKSAGSSQCDTTSVSYTTAIVPILQNNCYSCHGTNSNGGSGGIVLEGYANLDKWAMNGYLVGNVTHAPGYVPMPFGMDMLPECEVNTIVAWVHQGANNN